MKIYEVYHPTSLEKKYFANEQAMISFFERALSKEIKEAKKQINECGYDTTIELKIIKKYHSICAYENTIVNGKIERYPVALVGNCCYWNYHIINAKE